MSASLPVRRALSTANSATSPVRVLLIGPPGGGKGTVGKYMAVDFGCQVLSTGDLLRAEIERGTAEGQLAKDIIKRGALVPNDVVLRILSAALVNVGPRWILDGYPRNVEQAVSLDALLQELRLPLNGIFTLDVARDVILPRVSGRLVHVASGRVYNEHFQPPKVAGKDDVTGEPLIRRPDDEPDVVRKRLDLFDQATQPVLAFYRKKYPKLVHNIACETSPDGYKRLKPILETIAKHK